MTREIKQGASKQVGSIVCEERDGNLRIRHSHTYSSSIVVERADIDDLMVALDAVLGERKS